jgi:hypothetical protein
MPAEQGVPESYRVEALFDGNLWVSYIFNH